MAVVNFNYPKFKYTIASTGQPGAGYKLFTYEEGTSTKKTTWTSLAKTAENTNPIVLDANGEADVWIDGNYKFVLAPPTDTDPPTSAVWTYDAVRSSEATSSSSSSSETPINGSFEDDTDADTVPDNWTAAVLSGGTIAIDSTTSTHGTNSVKFTSAGSGGGSLSTDDYYEVEAGKDIGVRFSIISANADTHNKVEVYWYNASLVYISTTAAYDEAAANPTSWTRKYLSATAPATAKFARIVITGVAADSTTHSSTNIDNVEVDNTYTGELFNSSAPTPTELSYVSGVTSAIQTQIDNTSGKRGALVTNTGAGFTITTTQVLTFDSDVYDTSSIHDTSTNTDRLTVPAGVTKVRLFGYVLTQSTVADGQITLSFLKNGSALSAGRTVAYHFFTATPAATPASLQEWSPILEVSGGDYFTLSLSETSSGTVTVAAGPFFSMEVIE